MVLQDLVQFLDRNTFFTVLKLNLKANRKLYSVHGIKIALNALVTFNSH